MSRLFQKNLFMVVFTFGSTKGLKHKYRQLVIEINLSYLLCQSLLINESFCIFQLHILLSQNEWVAWESLLSCLGTFPQAIWTVFTPISPFPSSFCILFPFLYLNNIKKMKFAI